MSQGRTASGDVDENLGIVDAANGASAQHSLPTQADAATDRVDRIEELARRYFASGPRLCNCAEPVRCPPVVLDSSAALYHSVGQVCLHEEPVFAVLAAVRDELAGPTTAEATEAAEYMMATLKSRLVWQRDERLGRHVISLGETCLPKTVPTKWGLKRSRTMGERTMPFDLSIHPLQAVIRCMDDRFESYLANPGMSYDGKLDYLVDPQVGIQWNHETGEDWFRDGFAKFKATYSRRIGNFNADAAGNILWFICTHLVPPRDSVVTLCEALRRSYPLAEGPLALLSSDPNAPPGPSEAMIGGMSVSYLNLPLPFEGYEWWRHDHFTRTAGLAWEQGIVTWLEELMTPPTLSSAKESGAVEPVQGEERTAEAERTIAEYVLSGRLHDPAVTLKALLQIADVDHVQQPWVWKGIAEAARLEGKDDLFLQYSELFVFSDRTQRSDYRVGKLAILKERIANKLSNGQSVDAEVAEFRASSPSQFDIQELELLGVMVPSSGGRTFEAEQLIVLPRSRRETAPNVFALNGPHFAISIDAPATPTIRVVENVEYLAIGTDTALVRPDGRWYQDLSRSETLRRRRNELISASSLKDLGGTAVILNDIFTLSNYCHWMMDWLPRLLLAQEEVGGIDYVCTRHAAAAFEIESLKAIAGIDPERILVDRDDTLYRFDHAIVVDNDRIADTHAIWRGNPRVIDLLRRRVLGPLEADATTTAPFRRVYISRRDAGSRQVVNEAELLHVLAEFGIEAVELSGLTVRQQAKLFSECELVIGVHGAGLTNIVFMPHGATVVELLHYQFGSSAYATIAAGCHHRYAYMSCDSFAGSNAPTLHPAEQKAIRFQYADIWVETDIIRSSLESLYPDRSHSAQLSRDTRARFGAAEL